MLLLDTCGATNGVAIADLSPTGANHQPVLIAERSFPGRETQERLMSAMEEVLAEASLSLLEIDVITMVSGPGSFTGVRIGLAAAKGLGEAIGLPIVAISRLAVLAAQGSSGAVQAWIDAGRGDVFVGRYENGVCFGEQMMPSERAAAAFTADTALVVMEEHLACLGPAGRLVHPVGVREVLPMAVSRAQSGDFADPVTLDANYLRVPDAEIARLARERSMAFLSPELL